MSNEILDSLLREYSTKKLRAELDLEKRKNSLYETVPKLRQIENDLNTFAISTAKNILINNENSLNSFKEKINKLKKEKAKILNELNLPSNYLQPFYDCTTCNDTGYYFDDTYKTKMCNCLKQKILNNSFNKSNIYNLDKQNFSSFNENIFSNNIDVTKYKTNISPRKNIQNIKNNCINFVNNFDNPQQKNLLFTGNTGLR